MLNILFYFIVISYSYEIFDGKDFKDSWALINTAGTDIQIKHNETSYYLCSTLRCWDTIRVQRSKKIESNEYNFFSYLIYYESKQVQTMKFRTRLFSCAYNQQTETELKPYDYIVKSGKLTKVYVPLTYTNTRNVLQTFSIQRIESTDLPIEFKIFNITLEKEGIPTPNQEIIIVNEESSSSSHNNNNNNNTNGSISLTLLFIQLLLLFF